MEPIRVLLADDQALLRAGFAMMLSVEEEIEVVGQAANGAEAVEFAATHPVDIILMDVQMPVLDGIRATEQVVQAGTAKVIILTTFERDDYLFDALRAGASGFLLKNSDPDDLVAAVHAVAGGHALLAPEMTVRVIERFTRQLHAETAGARRDSALPGAGSGAAVGMQPGGTQVGPAQLGGAPSSSGSGSGSGSTEQRKLLASLTSREREVLEHVAAGRSNAEIAAEMFVAEATVKTHVSNLLGKIQVRDRVQAVVFAYESALILPGDKPAAG
ncbi:MULTISPECIES: response regulator transcription factor [unclassified Arthrobacter]|uniref:response regulator n=1 Tax=unclassified Arthrobacter TaxID=235627 RepID=UPI001E5DE2D2|nr:MULTISPECIES: response regulator transcription factor [unclassified Arthrobacter]MCC9144588.1 response regulator transcription factor [Arthrobacter sp. zg-Y919]MDK1275814.1 response regulator transcription factor [Arthrobacter sp. zg.Y919]WIB02822.1 response regulator transcription factor [Arthrobacter sp. zg-Y919]